MKSLSYSGAGGIRTHQRIMCSRRILSYNNGSVPVLMGKERSALTSPHIKTSFLESDNVYSKFWEIINHILLLPVVLFSGNRQPMKNWTGLEMGYNSVNSRQRDDIPYIGLLFASVSLSYCSCRTRRAINDVQLSCAGDDSRRLLSWADSK